MEWTDCCRLSIPLVCLDNGRGYCLFLQGTEERFTFFKAVSNHSEDCDSLWTGAIFEQW